MVGHVRRQIGELEAQEGGPVGRHLRRTVPPSMPSPDDPSSGSATSVTTWCVTLGLAEALGDLDDAPLDAPEHARRREAPAGVALAGRQPGEDLDPLRDRLRPRTGGTCPPRSASRHVVAQDEVRQVRPRHEHALRPGEAARVHRSKKPSIFAHTPPIACISPSWFTLPVTATPWSMPTSASALSTANSSLELTRCRRQSRRSSARTRAARAATSGRSCPNMRAR